MNLKNARRNMHFAMRNVVAWQSRPRTITTYCNCAVFLRRGGLLSLTKYPSHGLKEPCDSAMHARACQRIRGRDATFPESRIRS
jgi:hypothetical protein